MRFLSSSAFEKAPKFRLAASCSAAETIAALLGPRPGPLFARGLPPTWYQRPKRASAAAAFRLRPTARRAPPTASLVASPALALFLARRGLRPARLGLLGSRLLALGLVCPE